ncbi:hypothetical protein J6590_033756 [Homalodisca vitripennis]|nr:hypothetical protein J6590_033756 [Homalodisca vitripennis]
MTASLKLYTAVALGVVGVAWPPASPSTVDLVIDPTTPGHSLGPAWCALLYLVHEDRIWSYIEGEILMQELSDNLVSILRSVHPT